MKKFEFWQNVNEKPETTNVSVLRVPRKRKAPKRYEVGGGVARR